MLSWCGQTTAMNEVLNIVQRADTPRAQVLIEAAIVEISMNDDFEAGVELSFTGLQWRKRAID